MDNDFLIEMVDGGIKNIEYEQENWGGCPTCNYGSSYIDEFLIRMTRFNIRFKVDAMYEHVISEAALMKFFIKKARYISTLTEEEFLEYLKSDECKKNVLDDEWGRLKSLLVNKEKL